MDERETSQILDDVIDPSVSCKTKQICMLLITIVFLSRTRALLNHVLASMSQTLVAVEARMAVVLSVD